MVDTAAWLVDRVIPEVPVRQWVLSLPYRVRVMCAYDPTACAAVRRILVRAVSGYYERQARSRSGSRPCAGAVAFVQRFDSGLRVNVHMHVLWLDGVFTHEPGLGKVEFCEHAEVTDGDVKKLVQAIRDRVQFSIKNIALPRPQILVTRRIRAPFLLQRSQIMVMSTKFCSEQERGDQNEPT
ncbi:MAG: hypothetical protein ABIP94_00660 [Planctomycetota bacterium]